MKKRILVIDDEEILVKTFANFLGRLNYEVSVATRPEDAIERAVEEPLDLIISDIRMPGKNGIETMQEIRSRRREKGQGDIPVIFLTGFADRKLEEEAQSLNPIAYIYKPFDAKELLSVIDSSLAPR